jgi:hypothetical protein
LRHCACTWSSPSSQSMRRLHQRSFLCLRLSGVAFLCIPTINYNVVASSRMDPQCFDSPGSGSVLGIRSVSRTRKFTKNFTNNLIPAFRKDFFTYVGTFYDLLPT